MDDDAVIKEYNDNESYDYKEECVQNELENYPEIQRKLLKKKKDNALLLFDLFDDAGDYNISTEYEFQKQYIEEYKKNNSEDINAVPIALKNLYDKFELNQTIHDEYEEDLFLVDSEKYNL